VVAARTAGIDAIDAPYPAYQDPDGYRRSAEEASVLGFDGKWAIHPSQIPIANEVFAPTAAEIRWAEETSRSYRAAEGEGTGAIGVDGMLVDAAHMRHVETILERAARAGRAG
jgi:citrate lyase subunit beta/citryl-CoA lyase